MPSKLDLGANDALMAGTGNVYLSDGRDGQNRGGECAEGDA